MLDKNILILRCGVRELQKGSKGVGEYEVLNLDDAKIQYIKRRWYLRILNTVLEVLNQVVICN